MARLHGSDFWRDFTFYLGVTIMQSRIYARTGLAAPATDVA